MRFYRFVSNIKYYLPFLLIGACQTDTFFEIKDPSTTKITFNNTIKETDEFNILTEEYIFNGGGVASADFDNDGQLDLFFTGNQVANKLYLNRGNWQFEDISQPAGIEATNKWSTGVTTVDINGDGWIDIYVCAAMNEENRANMLFVNQGLDENKIPHFTEEAFNFGIAEKGNSMGAVFFDYDRDGLLDLYVLNNEQSTQLPTNYRKKIEDGTAVSNDRLFRNTGEGRFEDVTYQAGILIEGFGLGVAVLDINKDQYPDLYIGNDYITNDLLYVNNGDGTFSNQIDKFIKHQSMFTMGVDASDFDNDGSEDIVTLDMLGETNYRKKTTISYSSYESVLLNKKWGYQTQHSRNMLHKSNGVQSPFSEVGMFSGVYQTDWSWSPLFFDADNDSRRDLFITNGFPRDITDKDFSDFRQSVSRFVNPSVILDCIPVVKQSNYVFKNLGGFTFEDTTMDWGMSLPSFSNGAIFTDLDNDGDLDYVINNINDHSFVYENKARQKKQIQLSESQSKRSNR